MHYIERFGLRSERGSGDFTVKDKTAGENGKYNFFWQS